MNLKVETPNMRFEHNGGPSKVCLGQRSNKVMQGHQRSPSAKNKKIAISFKFLQNLKQARRLV